MISKIFIRTLSHERRNDALMMLKLSRQRSNIASLVILMSTNKFHNQIKYSGSSVRSNR